MSLTPNEAESAANVATATASASTIVPPIPLPRLIPIAIATTIQSRPSLFTVPRPTKKSFRAPIRCADTHTAILASISGVRGDVAKTRVDQAIDAVGDQSRSRQPQ